jgi:cell division protein FtsN
MKKFMVLGAALCVAIAFTSCGTSKESAYKKAYEKAKAQEEQQTATSQNQQQEAAVTPLVTKQADQTTVTNADNTPVRQEEVTLINGNGLKQYSVVVGSFGLKSNAEGMQSLLKQGGYDAQVVYNSQANMYRVVSGTYDDKSQAVQSRDAIRGSKFNKNSDAWLLYKK